ncbi:MAG: tyrosine-protein phosphatase, partial [Pontibacterium sp.]
MIDLHSHLLPGIDDGSPNMAESLALARIAVADGIQHITFTPHIHPGRYENVKSTIMPVFESLEHALKEEGIPLSVAMSGEVRLSAEVLAMVAQNQIPFLGEWDGKKVMLLELPHNNIPPGSDKLVKWLLDRNILPMIAHPERNKEIMQNLDSISPFVEMGCLFQVTAMSVAGKFGTPAASRAVDLLTRGWVTVLATDAHNADHRPPILSEGYEAAKAFVGEDAAFRLVNTNPAKIVGL